MKERLGERDRAFFSLVARAAFANPFGQERAALDAQIGDTSADDPRVLARVSTRLSARLEVLREGGRLTLARYAEEDRERLFAAFLFSVFHRYIDEIDRLIEVSGRVRFARALVSELIEGGVAEAQARRALELFFQMRRAHLAIGRRLIGAGPSMRKLREEASSPPRAPRRSRASRAAWSAASSTRRRSCAATAPYCTRAPRATCRSPRSRGSIGAPCAVT